MKVPAAVSRFLPSAERHGNPIRAAWDRFAALPGGKALFSRFVGFVAPYTGTIDARVLELRRGYAKVALPDRRIVRNHLRSIHAVALANLAELTGNIALAYSLPDDARFIVAAMSIEYLKKARGPITGECRCPVPETSERMELLVPVSLFDQSGAEVARATLRSLVGPKKSD